MSTHSAPRAGAIRWRYRIRQVLMRLGARRGAGERDDLERVLSASALRLFEQMPPGDQAHALCVWHTVHACGSVTLELEQAALLHDVGKAGGGLTLAHRTLIVLLEHLAPTLLVRWAAAALGSWRYPFYVHREHGELGARRCEQVGCSSRVVALVRYHGAPSFEDLEPMLRRDLEILAEADNRC